MDTALPQIFPFILDRNLALDVCMQEKNRSTSESTSNWKS